MTASLTIAEPQPADSPSTTRSAPPSHGGLISFGVVLFFVLVGHAWSLPTGLFLDDHAHFAHLREGDWSFRSAVESSRLGIVGDVMDLWGRTEAGLRFFRPIAFWIMKAEYTLAGWHPAIMHGFSLAWHLICAMLTGTLAMRCFGSRFWATVAASLMAIHPGHTATVYWIACQTELLTTAMLLLAILCYARSAGWGRRLFLVGHDAQVPEPTRPIYLLPTLVFYALALGCRENAVLFPAVCVAGDYLFGARRLRVRWEYVALALLLGGYFVVRSWALGGFNMPAKPYITPINDPTFPRFIVEKIVYYTLGLFGFLPVIPMAGQAFFAERPASFYGGFAMTLVILTIIWGAYRFHRAMVWPVLWIACFTAPVLPVFASSHHLYLPSVGTVLLLTAGLAALGGLTRRAASGDASAWRPTQVQKVVCGLVLLAHAVGLGLLTWASGFAYQAGTRTEDILIDEVLRRSKPIRDGDHFFFINMPVLAYYALPAIEARIDRRDLHGHVLTFSPWLMRMEKPGTVEVLDRHRLRVRAAEDHPYFEAVTGNTLLLAMGFEGVPAVGQPIRADGFTVTPLAANERGITEIEFAFDRPIDSPDYHFYFGSPHFLAYPLQMPEFTSTAPSH